jgi:hypothetical protein
MPTADIRDFNIRSKGHPKYSSTRVLEDRTIEFVVQKLENMLFTNKGDVLGDPDFGANLEYYLWSTNVPVGKIESEIRAQIEIYIPELKTFQYTLSVEIYQGTVRDILQVNIKIKDTKVNFIVR